MDYSDFPESDCYVSTKPYHLENMFITTDFILKVLLVG